MHDETVVVVGLGEVGGPLLNILNRSYHCTGVDIAPVDIAGPCSVLHVCIPFQIPAFIETTCDYIAKYRPRYTVINSTIAPGTTRAIGARSGAPVAYSPVRGKHVKMEADMLRYKKFVAASSTSVLEAVTGHFAGAGFATGTFPNLETGEVAKLLETTWLGMLVAWAQEVERIADGFGAGYQDVNAFIEEIDFLPRVFPGVIGGHCVLSNIAILQSVLDSDFLDLIVRSNEEKLRKSTAVPTSLGA